MPSPTPSPRYSPEDAQQILHLAIARQVEAEEVTRDQLLEIAAELNISPAELAMAEREWVAQRGEAVDRAAFDRHRQQRFRHRFGQFSIVSAFLLGLDFLTGGGIGWSLYFLFPWALGVSLDGWKTFQLQGESYEGAFKRWQQRRRIKTSVTRLLDRWLSA
ncbi:2TM domain-containing protein [Leptolyngbya ohadii]|uniref:2TM domain-containing protein n=1 Tax=Leptolyngbya ohadii TaxID=1962290 RepID=UPI000B598BBE|nr:2TM domain-containing protein [Leptolyngbya ohadii]